MNLAEARRQITDKMIFNLLTVAFEGGSNYWIARAEVIKRAKPGTSAFPLREGDTNVYLADHCIQGSVKLYVDDESNGRSIDRDVLTKGMDVFISKYPSHWTDALLENEDAETADIYLQCCLFGEVIYG